MNDVPVSTPSVEVSHETSNTSFQTITTTTTSYTVRRSPRPPLEHLLFDHSLCQMRDLAAPHNCDFSLPHGPGPPALLQHLTPRAFFGLNPCFLNLFLRLNAGALQRPKDFNGQLSRLLSNKRGVIVPVQKPMENRSEEMQSFHIARI